MPKRRVSRTAAQKAASRRNLVKAREARRPNKTIAAGQARINSLAKQVGWFALDAKKPTPTGKLVTLMHRTSAANASKILKEGFKSTQTNTPIGVLSKAGPSVYGVLPSVVNKWKGYGEAVVAVRVPRRLVHIDESMSTYNPPPIRVAVKDLAGRKIRRIK